MWTHLRRLLGAARPPDRHRCRALGLCALCAALVGSLLPNRAAADGRIRLSVEWDKLGDLLRRPEVESSPSWRPDAERSVVQAVRDASHSLLEGGPTAGRWSLVGRDWDAARALMGRTTATDEVQRGRSKRMVLLRGRLIDGPVTPFAQLGLGQWRIDPDTPSRPHESLVAGQLGVGIEYAIAGWASVALEADCTLLDPGRLQPSYPQALEPPGAPLLPRDVRWMHPPALWGSFLAARARF
jgi:hypothetical protein